MFKLSPQTNAMIETASKLEGTTRSEFVEHATRKAAERVIGKLGPSTPLEASFGTKRRFAQRGPKA